ncbi:helix-turn-helix transcriptional regulator [Micromonospora parathelypteridis]|uniref:DNA-binding CsgD family transcriptional regulator/energy-coupling factor transporter ATP-binding protein EcfA2 n=1 Tax=Micromonospora parathelypteridis TaxID=1839617 RepID=A0A840W4P3_9ACTN|nr:LuxR family transcriptional regulator [Micromonospora parathelypteridis]MBB5479179.1 DNA-binding CsgD family transcriptional regulator/energy-coupling factor transporter ATP-binding protein EcfA2 [Micromonospora parathelypteridis]GGO02580.1 LuxR family transcriptional regulator [Micromonospora parathelypteridis]
MAPDIVGRNDALEIVDGFCERSRESGQSLVIVGEPGLGKTTLLRHAAQLWTKQGGRVLAATAVEFEADISFAGLQQILSPAVDSIPTLAGERASVLEALFDPNTSVTLDRLAVAEALRHLLRAAAREAPTLVLVDDLQWLDRSSAAVLTLLARRLTGTRVGFLGSTRPAAEGFFERARLDEYELTPVDEQAATEILLARYPDLTPAIRRRVLAVAAGNPLALVELPLILTDQGHDSSVVDLSVVPLNRRLQAAFSSRIENLPDATRQSLLFAALEATGSLRGLEVESGERLLESLAPAERARLIHIADQGTRVAFAHPLTRAAVVNASTAAERRRVHARLAEAVRDDPDRRAWHLAQSSRGPDERAASSLEEAGYRLVSRGDTVGAVTALTNASMLSPAKPKRARRLAAAAYVGAHLGGGIALAGDTLREVRQLDSAHAGSLDTAVATSFVILNADGDVDTAHRVLAGALDAVSEKSHPIFQIRAALLTLLYVCFFGGRRQLWPAFDALVSRLNNPAIDVVVLMRHTHSDPANADEAEFRQLDRLIETLDQVDDPGEIVLVGLASSWVDRLPGCRAALHRALEMGRAADDTNVMTQALALLALDSYFMGQWQDSERYLAESLSLTNQNGLRLFRWATQHWIATLAAVRGDDETARRITNELIYWAVPRGVVVVSHLCHYTRALVALGRQDYEEAYREATSIGPAGTIPPFRPVAIWAVLDVVEAAVRTNRHAEARAHVAAARAARLETISGRLSMLVTAAEALVSADDIAPSLFDRALATPEADRWPFDRARVELLFGQHLRRSRSRRAAREHLGRASAAFQRLGATRWTERADQELRAAGQRPGPQPRTESLTGRESLVAQMAATGMTNKEIGEELFLSARTVGAHLYRIFPKLGITSRAGLRDALTLIDKDRAPGGA